MSWSDCPHRGSQLFLIGQTYIGLFVSHTETGTHIQTVTHTEIVTHNVLKSEGSNFYSAREIKALINLLIARLEEVRGKLANMR